MLQKSDGQEFKENIMSLEEIIKNLVTETLSESQVRDIVGAPTLEESITCVCGNKLNECNESYEHMTQGV
jgi:hypothetical protein|tara:strand:- start:275 stop:484 length:210 start_codon:yes stop_codon:yes gene_type:complete